MLPREHHELRSESNVLEFNVYGEAEPQLCASGEKFVLLKNLPWKEMRELVEEYADLHDQSLLELFLKPADQLWKGPGKYNATVKLKKLNQKSPEALSIQTISYTQGRTHIAGWYASTPALTQAVQKAGLLEKYAKRAKQGTPAWQVVKEPFEVQRKVAQLLMRPNIRTMEWVRPASGLGRYASQRVLEIRDASTSTAQFLDAIFAKLLFWSDDPIKKGIQAGSKPTEPRPFALAWFAVWMLERGLLLFPLKFALGRGLEILPLRYREFTNGWLRQPIHRDRCDEYLSSLAPLLTKALCSPEKLKALIWTMNLASPGVAMGRISAEFLSHLKDFVTHKDNRSYIAGVMWRAEAQRLKVVNCPPQVLQSLTDTVIKRRPHVIGADRKLWDWIDRSGFKTPRARYASSDVQAGPNLLLHLENLRAIFPAVALRSAKTVAGLLGWWLGFLTTLPDKDVPSSILEIYPKLLDDVTSSGSLTLRSYLVELEAPSATQSAIFAVLKRAWKVAVRHANEDLLCPISDQLISRTYGSHKRSMTARRAIDMEILELLIEENRADDFNFSRSRIQGVNKWVIDERTVVDSDNGKIASVWWPGVAVIVDLLLHVPMRHKQARYLDSGEGDEFILNIDTLELSKNSATTAEPARREAFIQRVSISSLRDEPGLGMFINTNKTGTSYLFPWLRPDIARNIQRVIDWQMRFNPIRSPIPDRGDSREEIAANTDPILVYPIFRDPARHNNQPMSAQIVLEYFRALLRHVEKKYNDANSTGVRFFKPDGEPIYDIHALRVTGVTRLLNLGVDPGVVRLLVGHSSLTMTFYYDHVSNERITAAMESALEARRPGREQLLAMSDDDRKSFVAKLFSRGDQSDRTLSLFHTLVEEKNPFLDMRVDGICPGMSCTEAGVWRPRACSLCRYNISGAPFLAGLELTLNNLMAEVILNERNLAALRERLYEKRADGVSTRSLEAEIARLEDFIDHVLQQWEAQFQYIKQAEKDLSDWLSIPESNHQSESIRLFSPDTSRLEASLQESHHLAHYSRLVEGAKVVEGFVPVIGAREARDEMLLEIARHEQKLELFFRLDIASRRKALDEFAKVLLSLELSSEDMQRLIDGQSRLPSQSPALEWLFGLSALIHSQS